jgi:hypothetical protein
VIDVVMLKASIKKLLVEESRSHYGHCLDEDPETIINSSQLVVQSRTGLLQSILQTVVHVLVGRLSRWGYIAGCWLGAIIGAGNRALP